MLSRYARTALKNVRAIAGSFWYRRIIPRIHAVCSLNPSVSRLMSALAAGTELRANGHAIGEITSAYGARGFALVRLDRLEEAAGAAIEADGSPVTVTRQDWLKA